MQLLQNAKRARIQKHELGQWHLLNSHGESAMQDATQLPLSIEIASAAATTPAPCALPSEAPAA